ncbi:MAG: glycoside hydrolase/phage tail family protein [Pseudomonadota bacterium]
MATILLSAAGAALGGSVGGSFLGLSASVLGRAAGATLGRIIDSRILGAGSPAVETGKVDRFRLAGASEGAPIGDVHGRARVSGQVIWATRFLEQRSVSGGGGKGGPSEPTVTEYSYSVSLALALCKGQITRVGRVWADGNEVSKYDFNMRVYTGSEDQLPDPKISAVEGAEFAPAYRGTAYVVFEDLPLGRFGNRVPNFSFEVMRSGEGDLSDIIEAVALIPGTGEYALATTPVHFNNGGGRVSSANVHTPSGRTDFETSLEALSEELPNARAVSLVVSWFGTDLRCGSCDVAPRVEQKLRDGSVPWRVNGIGRSQASAVPVAEGRPVYGGTPSDASVLQAIAAMQSSGQRVMFYPFILMEQMAGNGLTDPWTGAPDQPVLPWRGRITTSLAPGQAGTPDATAAAEAEVQSFFGTATAGQFNVAGGTVSYGGSDGFSYRRFILHYAHLCALAGGVDAFCIGSEMRGLTQIRGVNNSFPAVDALRALATEVRLILGPDVKIGYAADWTEYFGYQPQDGTGDVFFHLDPLWAAPEIDFVGIDNYMPLSDWRDGYEHADADWGSVHNIEYLKANIAGGEGYDWYYPSPQAEEEQLRKPITDGAFGEPWVYRYKDVRNWWSAPHHERVGGVRQINQTAWVPESKPIWFTEIGCAAIDKATNQPNKFLDPKSSESSLPKYSSGARDDLIQMQYLRAMVEFWEDADNNPTSGVYGASMVAPDRMYVWAWDARPYPFFPSNTGVWSDGDNYARGHWLNGRVTSRTLGSVIAELCEEAGCRPVDVGAVRGLVRGYALDGSETARAALQPLLLTFGVDAIEKNGALVFRNRDGLTTASLEQAEMARGEGEAVLTRTRAPEAESSGRVRLTYVEADGDYEARSSEGVFPDEATTSVSRSEVPLALTSGEARGVVERWLAEARVARDSAGFAVPPSSLLAAGDVVEIEGDMFRIDRVEEGGAKLMEAVRVERGVYQSYLTEEAVPTLPPVSVPLPVWAEMMELPLLTGDELPEAPWLAATAEPWPGAVAVYASLDGNSWSYQTELSRRAVMGETLTPLYGGVPGLPQRGPGVEVKITGGALGSIDDTALFAGGNAAAMSDGSGLWEVLQYRDAALIGEETWRLSHLLRGQQGTDAVMQSVWPAGSTFVLLDAALTQIPVSSTLRGITRRYRVGPASRPVDDASYVELTHASLATGLKPFAPVHLKVAPDGVGGHRISWIRRTRIGGDSWALADVPVGEAYEAYRVQVIAGGLLRREETVAEPHWTYEAAARAADGVTAPFTVEIAQLSDLYGPGHEARILIDV